MKYELAMDELNQRREKMRLLREEMRALQAEVEPVVIPDATFTTIDGTVRLSELFGGKDTLFLIHNMGRSCPSCTQWADGFNGVIDHLLDRAAFVVSSPDSPKVQAEFAAGRNWRFRMVSHEGTTFARDMGYVRSYKGREGYWPGVSVFRMQDKEIVRVSDTEFGPGDDFNPVWHFFDLIPGGPGDWSPRFKYN